MRKKVVVIGSGLAGTLICNQLVKHTDVTLLEAGEKDTIRYPEIDFVKKKFAEVKTLCVGGGGTTNLWHNGLIPINGADITSEEFHEVLNDAESYMDRAASVLYFNNKEYSNEYKNVISEVSSICDQIGTFNDGVDCLIYPKKYKKLEPDPKVQAFYSVSNIEFISEENRIKTLKFFINSNQISIDPDIIVISAGALGSPRIVQKVMSSGSFDFDSIGSGFIDHPMGFVGKVKFRKEFSEKIKKLCLFDKGDYVFRTAIRLRSECGKYACGVFLRPALTMDNNLSIYKFKSALGASNGMERYKNALSMKIFHPDIIAEIVAHLFGFNIPSRTYNILFIGEQKRANNRVFYNGERIKVDWCVTEEEISIYNTMLKKLSGMLSGISDEINIKTDLTEEWLWSAAHHSGTVSMGTSPENILDKDLKLKFCDNVYVCDGSVIQEHSYANTGLAIGQLALRLADRILN